MAGIYNSYYALHSIQNNALHNIGTSQMLQLKWMHTAHSGTFSSRIWLNKSYSAQSFLLSHSWRWLEANCDIWVCITPSCGYSFLQRYNRLTLEIIYSNKNVGKISLLGAPLRTLWRGDSKKDSFFHDFLHKRAEENMTWMTVGEIIEQLCSNKVWD